MRVNVEASGIRRAVRAYLLAHPGSTPVAISRAVDGAHPDSVLLEVRRLRAAGYIQEAGTTLGANRQPVPRLVWRQAADPIDRFLRMRLPQPAPAYRGAA